MTRVCLGGTFSAIHKGHLALLAAAFELGDEVVIGLTSDEMASGKGHAVPSYRERFRNLALACAHASGGKDFSIAQIDDIYGPAADGDFDVIVVSQERVEGARQINARRAENGLEPLRVFVVPMVLAADGRPISSSRVLAGEISPDGSLR